LHPAGGQLLAYHALASRFGPDQPIYGLQSTALHDPDREYDSLEAMAAHYAALIQAHQPEGPYHLLGWSMGGLLAMAVASQLESERRPVAFVGLLDTPLPRHDACSWEQDPLLGLVLACGSNIAGVVAGLDLQTRQTLRQALLALSPDERLRWLVAWGAEHHLIAPDFPLETLARQALLAERHLALLRAHTIRPIQAPLYVWEAGDRLWAPHPHMDWQSSTMGRVHKAVAEGNHFSMLQPPYVQNLAAQIQAFLRTKRHGERRELVRQYGTTGVRRRKGTTRVEKRRLIIPGIGCHHPVGQHHQVPW
jgi:thioesterase domain-containing protein